MSMAINRASYTGDPGIFDIFQKVAAVGAGFIPGVGSTLSQYISNIGIRGPTVAGPGSVPTFSEKTLAGTRVHLGHGHSGATGGHEWLTQQLARAAGGPMGIVNGQIPAPGIPAWLQRAIPGGRTGMMAAPNGAAMNGTMGGYHLNKSNYFLMSGEFVAAGTRWVKNRKRNPANARATSRAISRIGGAKKYTDSLSRISIRKKKC